MKRVQNDIISAEPRTISSRLAWVLAVALLAAALAVAIAVEGRSSRK